MKRALSTLACLAALASAAAAQSPQENKQKKLQEPFLKNGDWITDYEKALKESEETGKPIFAYMTRSYAP